MIDVTDDIASSTMVERVMHFPRMSSASNLNHGVSMAGFTDCKLKLEGSNYLLQSVHYSKSEPQNIRKLKSIICRFGLRVRILWQEGGTEGGWGLLL